MMKKEVAWKWFKKGFDVSAEGWNGECGASNKEVKNEFEKILKKEHKIKW